MTSSHIIFIPGVLLVGMFLGFILGARAARNHFDSRPEARRSARPHARQAPPVGRGRGGDGGGEKAAEKTSGKAAE